MTVQKVTVIMMEIMYDALKCYGKSIMILLNNFRHIIGTTVSNVMEPV